MAYTCKLYQKAGENLLKGVFGDLSAAATKPYVALLTSSYTPNQQTDEHWSDVSAYEVSGAGYSTGGSALYLPSDGVTVGLTIASSSLVISADAYDTTWATSTITARVAVVYRMAGANVASTDHLIGYIDFGENKSTSGTDFKIIWSASGVFTLTWA